MAILLMIFIIPISLVTAWIMNTSHGHSMRLIEQAQVDALAVSICHQRRLYLERVERLNSAIRVNQLSLDALAPACELKLPPGSCELLRAAEAVGRGLSSSMTALRTQHRIALLANESNLIQDNQLSRSQGILIHRPTLDDGLKEDPLNVYRQTQERILNFRYPKTWVPGPNFSAKNTFRYQFRPKRTFVVGASIKEKNLLGLRSFSAQAAPTGRLYESTAACRVESHSRFFGHQVRVKRIL